MMFSIDFQMTALHFAILRGNIEIVRLLLNRPEIDVNILYILFNILNCIQKRIFFMTFKNKYFNGI